MLAVENEEKRHLVELSFLEREIAAAKQSLNT
jgi:hypothetical protein